MVLLAEHIKTQIVVYIKKGGKCSYITKIVFIKNLTLH